MPLFMMGKKSILVIESKALFDNLLSLEKKKNHFIHFNHTNGLLSPESQQTSQRKWIPYRDIQSAHSSLKKRL
jgi:hypothetical protein